MSINLRLFLLIYLLFNLSLSLALKITVSPLIMLKEMKSVKTIETIFNELTKFDGSLTTSRLRVLAALLRSESFNQQYIKYCKTFSIYNFLCVGLQARMDKSLDLRRILSADCIAAASGVKFNEFEGELAPFTIARAENPVLSSNFKPSQWSINQFVLFLNGIVNNPKFDWSVWCGDLGISSEHFRPEIWGNLWHNLNYKCIERMTTQSKRIMLRSKYLAIFKPTKFDTQNQLLMKIVSLCAAQINLKYFNEGNIQEINAIKEISNSIIIQLLKDTQPTYSTSIARTSMRLMRNCGISSDALPFITSSPRNTFSNIHQILQNEPLVNASWLLNFIYIALNVKQILFNDLANQKMINWFFSLNPSIPNICQLLEMIGLEKNRRFREITLLHVNSNIDVLTQVQWHCPKYCGSLAVPLRERIKMLLMRKRIFPNHTLKLKLLYREKDQFWSLIKLIMRHEHSIFVHNTAVFEVGFNYASFQGLDKFFEHFLDCFMQNFKLYHVVDYADANDPKPIIIPSLALPMRVIKILFSVLARAAILDFNVPFYIHEDFLDSAYSHKTTGDFVKALKLQRTFYHDSSLTDTMQVSICEQINSDEYNDEMIVDQVMQLCMLDSFTSYYVPKMTVIRLLKWQLIGINTALKEMFPKEILFKTEEIYSFIFNRGIQ